MYEKFNGTSRRGALAIAAIKADPKKYPQHHGQACSMEGDVYLGLIAFGAVVMATIQLAGRRGGIARPGAGRDGGRFEQDVRPIIANLQKVSEEAARASAQAPAQVDRLDALVANVRERVEETAATVQQTILQPARDGLALLSGLKAVIASFPRAAREPAGPRGRKSAQAAPDDDLFIG
jgi:hypothetical protein